MDIDSPAKIWFENGLWHSWHEGACMYDEAFHKNVMCLPGCIRDVEICMMESNFYWAPKVDDNGLIEIIAHWRMPDEKS